MSLSNLPPGISESMIPGANDHDVSYDADITIFGMSDTYNNYVIDCKNLLNVLQRDFNVNISGVMIAKSDINKPTTIDSIIGVLYDVIDDNYKWNIPITLSGDTTHDMSYYDIDSYDVENEIIKEITKILNGIDDDHFISDTTIASLSKHNIEIEIH